MNSFSFTVELKRALPETAWPRTFAALRQDPLIWESLQGELGRRALARKPARPEDYSPAALALLALDSPTPLEAMRAAPIESIDPSLRPRITRAAKAAQEAEAARQGHSNSSLAEAGLLALNLREGRRSLDSWEGLAADLGKISPAVLAILFGTIPDPLEMLAVAIQGGSAHGQTLDSTLQAALCQPLTLEEQSAMVKELLSRVSVPNRLALLEALAVRRPSLAAEVASWAMSDLSLLKDPLAAVQLPAMVELGKSLWSAQVYRIAGQAGEALPILARAAQAARRMQAQVATRIARLAEAGKDSQAALTAWREAAELDRADPEPLAGLAYHLLEAGRSADVEALLHTQGTVLPSPRLLFTSARLAAMRGNLDKARKLAIQAAEMLHDQPDACQAGDLSFGLGRLLIDLNVPRQAAEVARNGLKVQPDNPELYELLGRAHNLAGEPAEAAQAAHLAVALAPSEAGYRQLLADSLELCEEWEAAYAERSFILSHLSGETEPGLLGKDLRALANCALRAGHPDLALQACQKLLQLDSSDGLAYTLLGEASAAMGDTVTALDHLQRATQLAPGQAAPWLAQARTYQQSGQPQKALESLQTAVRAAPDSPEVHLALGEAYLDQHSPTQALAALRRAADLAGPAAHGGYGKSARIGLRLGQTLLQLGHLPEARQTLEKAFQSAPANPEVAEGYAHILLILGEERAALAPLEVYLKSEPRRPEPYLDYARCLLALSATSYSHLAQDKKPQADLLKTGAAPVENAIAPLRRALELAPDHAEARALLAEALAASGNYLAAMEAYRRALETALAEETIWQTRLSLGLGHVALEIGQIETAIAALQEANQSDPLNPEIQRALAEAYDAAGLTENAFQAARAAILLAPDRLDLLTWFADQALELRVRPGVAAQQAQAEAVNALHHAVSLAPNRTDLFLRLGQILMQIGETEEARNTFQNFVSQQSKSAPAERSVADLYQAAKNLMGLNDAKGAVVCLELALQSNRRRGDRLEGSRPPNTPTLLDLLTELAAARYMAGNPQGALEALEQAIAIDPGEAALYLDQADLHLELGQLQMNRNKESQGAAANEEAGTDEIDAEAEAPVEEEAGFEAVDHIQAALDCLEIALNLNPEDSSLHRRAALIQRVAGELPAALAHALQALTPRKEVSFSTGSNDPGPARMDTTTRALAADLARAQFMHQQARELVAEPWPAAGPETPIERIDYYCLRAELALEAGELLFAAEDMDTLLDYAPDHPRVLAIQAQLVGRRGDTEVALQILRDAVASLNISTAPLLKGSFESRMPKFKLDRGNEHGRSGVRGIGLLSHSLRNQNNALSVAEAAVELHQWDTGLQILKETATASPYEPLFQLRLARALVLRAEFQSLYQELEVVHHAPGESALGEEARQEFLEAIQAAERQTSRWHTGNLGNKQPILRWRARGQAVFQPNPRWVEALAALPLDTEDVTARVACLRRLGDLAAAGLAARSCPQNPRVLMQLSLALAKEKPRQALAAAHAAVEAVLQPEAVLRSDRQAGGEAASRPNNLQRSPLARREDVPLAHALLARLVHQSGNRASDHTLAIQAIQTALSQWPEEPRWHALAARIYQGKSNHEELADPALMIHHLEQAIQLEPKYAPHYLAIGRVYMWEGSTQRAVGALEQAARLAPDHPEPWLLLAQAFRELGDLDQAAARAERAVTLAPQDSVPLLLRGEIALETNNPRGAQSRAQAALRLNPEDPAALLLLARSLGALERPDEALSTLEKALLLAKDPLPFQIERASLLLRFKGQEIALQALQELADRYPSEPSVLSLLAECLAEGGQGEAAIHIAQRALRAGQETQAGQASFENAHMHFLLGRLLRRAGQLDQAIQHLSDSIQQAPQWIEPYLELGLAHQDRRQYNQALSAYQQAITAAPNDPRGYYHAGVVNKESKDYLAAESMLRKAASLAPDDLSIHRLLAAVVAINLVNSRRETVREPQAGV